jgi:predicted DCC family thiol-disulfide oxidoreductase YuxK
LQNAAALRGVLDFVVREYLWLSVETKPVILFDGVCNLCNNSVQFVINRDPEGKFRFAALQSEHATKIMRSHRLDPSALHSIILVDGDKVYQRSRAALEIVRRLSGLWPLLYGFLVIPPFIRNWLYDRVAANRYKWFGKKDECMIPTPELRSRFL